MSDHTSQVAAEDTAPVTGDTAPPETVDTGEQGEAEAPKTFTQDELDRIVGEAKAKERRRLEREQRQAAEVQPIDAPDPKSFKGTQEEFNEAVVNYRAAELVAQREANKRQTQIDDTYKDRADEARTKYKDFNDVVTRSPQDGGPPVSDLMFAAIKESDIGPEIAYHLGKNPDEARRIYGLNPVSQIREIGKLEVKLAGAPAPVKKASSAPDPINPVGSRSQSPAVDTSDPRSTKIYSPSDWIDKRNRELRARG